MKTLYEIYDDSKLLAGALYENEQVELSKTLDDGIAGASTSGEALSCIGWVCNQIQLNSTIYPANIVALSISILKEVNKFFKGTQTF